MTEACGIESRHLPGIRIIVMPTWRFMHVGDTSQKLVRQASILGRLRVTSG